MITFLRELGLHSSVIKLFL